jgi:hypothetical protein
VATTTTAPEKERIKQLPVRMPEDLYNALKGAAFYTDRSMNEIMVTALTEYLRASLRSDAVGAIVQRAQEDYRVVLDKLADL